jgi:hypothetical protein
MLCGMGFIVKVSNHGPPGPQWIGRNAALGSKQLVPRAEACVFPTEDDALWAIRSFTALVQEGVQFELQEEST